jgi:hypothetical protein
MLLLLFESFKVVLEHWIEESELWGLVKRREMKEGREGW